MQITEWAQQLTRLWRANSTKSPAAPSNHSNLAEPTEKEMLAAGWMPTEDTQEPVEYPDPYDDAVKLELSRIKGWSGATVADLQKLDPMKLYDLDQRLLAEERLRSTIPPEYQGQVHQAEIEDPDPSKYMTTLTHTIEIVAIDQENIALVRSYVCSNYEGAEGWSFTPMPKEQAFDTIDNYRSSHALLKQYAAPGQVLPSHFDYADPEGSFIRAAQMDADEVDADEEIEQRSADKP